MAKIFVKTKDDLTGTIEVVDRGIRDGRYISEFIVTLISIHTSPSGPDITFHDRTESDLGALTQLCERCGFQTFPET